VPCSCILHTSLTLTSHLVIWPRASLVPHCAALGASFGFGPVLAFNIWVCPHQAKHKPRTPWDLVRFCLKETNQSAWQTGQAAPESSTALQ